MVAEPATAVLLHRIPGIRPVFPAKVAAVPRFNRPPQPELDLEDRDFGAVQQQVPDWGICLEETASSVAEILVTIPVEECSAVADMIGNRLTTRPMAEVQAPSRVDRAAARGAEKRPVSEEPEDVRGAIR